MTEHASFAKLMNVLLIALIAGCGAPPQDVQDVADADAEAPEGPVTGDTLVWREGAEPSMMHPFLALTDGTGRYISSFIFEDLVQVDNETLELIPGLAESWEVADDHLSYTYYLNKDAKFSDGVPLTSKDVKFTWDSIANPENDTAPIRSYLSDVTECEVLDDHTVRFHVSKPYFGHELMLGGLTVIPQHIYSVGDFNTHPGNRAPVGSGPYVFDSWDTGQQIVITRNENYWNQEQAGLLDKRIFRFIRDDNSALQVLLRHDADVMDFQGEMWVRQASTPEFEEQFHKLTPDSPVPGYLSRYNYIGWNTRKPQFDDKRVRQALCMLFDRQLIIDTVWGGIGTVISGPIYHKLPEYNSDVAPLPFDPERAAQLLDEAGWIDRDQDGVRERDGVPFEFELSFGSGLPEYEQLSTVYQEELARVGIRMRTNPIEWATFQERVHNRTFDACMLAWLPGLAVDPYQLWHSSQAETGSNYPGLKNPEIDEILDTARLEFDRDKRIEMYHRFHEILHEEQPYIFLYARPGLVAVDKRVEGITVYPSGIDPNEWWVPKSAQRYP